MGLLYPPGVINKRIKIQRKRRRRRKTRVRRNRVTCRQKETRQTQLKPPVEFVVAQPKKNVPFISFISF
jgi:hypothetical protein